MNRQGFPKFTSRHLLQGLFASLAMLVTLIGGQQLVKWNQPPQAAPTVLHYVAPQQHFSAISASGGYTFLAAAEETETARSEQPQERWVF
ncbi:MAG: hypothetical protein V4749_11730 [Pseudomonadota bacterium]